MRKLVHSFLLLGALSQSMACIITTDDDDDDTPAGNGYFSFTWTLVAGSSTVTCDDVGVDAVSSLATLSGTMSGYEDLFDCTDMAGTTRRIPLGSYTVVVQSLDCIANCDDADLSNDQFDTLGTSAPLSGTLDVDGETVSLGNFMFTFAAAANVLFNVDFGVAGGLANCAGGEDIEGELITVFELGQQVCIPLELLVNNNPGLDDICSDTEVLACQNADVVHTLLAVAPGDYEIWVDGLNNDGTAWHRCFQMPAALSFTVGDGDEDLQTLVVGYMPDASSQAFCDSL